MAAVMMSLPKNTETAVSSLIRQRETCKWGQNVGIKARNQVLFTELKYLEWFRRLDPHGEIQNSL